MGNTGSIWALIVVAFVAANLPFVNERWLAVWPARSQVKGLPVRLLELVLLYFAVGGLGRALESHAGQVHPQGWEFYATTACLFLTFAFPGFVYRYLARKG